MSELIIILFFIQILVMVTAAFAIVLVYSPIRRLLHPIARLGSVGKTLGMSIIRVMNRTRLSIGQILANVSSITNVIKSKRGTSSAGFSLKRLVSTLVAGRRLLGVLRLFRMVRKNRFWGTFRILMMAGPVLIPVLTSLKKLIRKPASAG